MSVLALAGGAGCEERPDRRVEPAPAPTLSVPVGVDSGVLGDPSDPPAPAGDLKAEIDRFLNIDTCVAERAKLDPLVGDALGAIGYETFLRDACRLLEAAKDRKRETCERIDSSALRARCQTWVAMVASSPDQCPMQFEGLVTRGRDPSCIAIAARDQRLCNGEARAVQRGTCEAMVSRDPAKCDVLVAHQRPACQREVTRWRQVLPPPLEGLAKLPNVRGKVVVHGVSGTPDPPSPEVDLAADFVRGVVVVTSRDRVRFELGTVVESEAARIAASPQKRARVGLAVIVEPGKKDASRPVLQKLELDLPGDAPLVSPPVVCDCKLTARADKERGGEVSVTLDGTLSQTGRSYSVHVEIESFVRDVAAEGVGVRVLPPAHPPLSGRRVDGG